MTIAPGGARDVCVADYSLEQQVGRSGCKTCYGLLKVLAGTRMVSTQYSVV